MKIVGGFYREISLVPEIDQMFGSGGRAAAILSEITNDVTLHTYTENDSDIAKFEKRYAIKVKKYRRDDAISFSYFHPLSTPHISKSENFQSSIKVSGEVVLRFGLIEGDAVVDANRVVFDPQTWKQKAIYSINGSKANNLVIVLNELELAHSTSANSLIAQAQELLELNKAEAIVVKRGVKGCFVLEKNGSEYSIPSYLSNKVTKIGTGDVFSTIFAFYWGVKKKRPSHAAELASKHVACFCESGGVDLDYQKIDKLIPINFESFQPVTIFADQAGLGKRYILEEAKYLLLQFGITAQVEDSLDNLPNYKNPILILGETFRNLITIENQLKKNKSKIVVFDASCDDWFMGNSTPENITLVQDFTSAIYQIAWASAQ
ncbi:nucleoside 2-deoxyribosyltransferase protein [Catenovulum agarivorans DS-2]|uniref:Nucleoside 2-deoxyribosyltransferase protein n=1 Tax=Catenovulum agarivorans DS-2 TaxID=1328313 RepID=W7QE47_9ALTE|nr:PfkB family carbohydrate kinase [Catenovulum agarivorans]EWH10196.1 nucleoside 2-deoxyribosyltransferase protein [Catenovulum agarivorans DS-2]